jgi:Phage integrase SAM-like domain
VQFNRGRSMAKKASTREKNPVQKHRTNPVAETKFSVPNYPTKLTIFKISASRFFWVRYYDEGRIFKKSTKTDERRKAIEFAKRFYDEINFKKYQGLIKGKEDAFEVCAQAIIEQQKYKVLSKEMSAEMAKADEYRLAKEVLPFFRSMSVKDIDYFTLEKFKNKLIEDSLVASTISNYMNLVGKILKYANQKGLIIAVPQIPKPKKQDNARGWFTTKEYGRLWNRAKKLANKTFEFRKRVDKDGNEVIFTCERLLPTVFERAQEKKDGIKQKKLTKAQQNYKEITESSTYLKRVDMTDDMHDLIVFMINSFIRPTDLKWMKHKHVDVIEGEYTYLRLRLPTSKKHDKPITTMHHAVTVYKRLKERHSQLGMAKPDDYVFLPMYHDSQNEVKDRKAREDALIQIQRQFAVVMESAELGDGPNDEHRTLYSLRHTCIMYRLLYGYGMDLLTLANNARTSPDMISRFYASQLTGEMNIDMIQSKRSRRKVTNRALNQPVALT